MFSKKEVKRKSDIFAAHKNIFVLFLFFSPLKKENKVIMEKLPDNIEHWEHWGRNWKPEQELCEQFLREECCRGQTVYLGGDSTWEKVLILLWKKRFIHLLCDTYVTHVWHLCDTYVTLMWHLCDTIMINYHDALSQNSLRILCVSCFNRSVHFGRLTKNS